METFNSEVCLLSLSYVVLTETVLLKQQSLWQHEVETRTAPSAISPTSTAVATTLTAPRMDAATA